MDITLTQGDFGWKKSVEKLVQSAIVIILSKRINTTVHIVGVSRGHIVLTVGNFLILANKERPNENQTE